jgi:hypothetical protein
MKPASPRPLAVLVLLLWLILGLSLPGRARGDLATNNNGDLATNDNSAQHKHWVFLIHGLKGNPKKTFCDLEKILEKQYSGKNLVVHSLGYDTKSETKKPIDFMHEIQTQILQAMGLSHFNDPYSFVVHSQGGIIATKYIRHCLSNQNCGNTPPNLKQLISLGTPFWGAPNANRIRAGGIIPFVLRQFSPDKQVEELAIGSTSLTSNRQAVLHEWRKKQESVFNKIEIINVAGEINQIIDEFDGFMADIFKFLFQDSYEFDGTVDIANANFDFISYREKVSENKNNPPIEIEKVDFSDYFYVVTEAHAEFPPQNGVACFGAYTYMHENSWKILKTHLDTNFQTEAQKAKSLYGFLPEASEFANPARNFAIEIKFSLPAGYNRSVPMSESNVEISHEASRIENPMLKSSLLAKYSGIVKGHYLQTFFHNGVFQPNHALTYTDYDENWFSYLNYKFTFPGWEVKTASIPVRAAISTVARIPLYPNFAFPQKEGTSTSRLFMEDGDVHFIIAAYPAVSNPNKLSSLGHDIVRVVVKSPGQPMEFRDIERENFPENFAVQNQEKLENSIDQCVLGRVSRILQPNKFHSNKGYSNLENITDDNGRHLMPGSYIKILGRYNKSHTRREEYSVKSDDFYLASSGLSIPGRHGLEEDKKSLFWVRVRDVDVTEKSCSRH